MDARCVAGKAVAGRSGAGRGIQDAGASEAGSLPRGGRQAAVASRGRQYRGDRERRCGQSQRSGYLARRCRCRGRYPAREGRAARYRRGASAERLMAQLTDDCFAFGGPLLSIDAVERLIVERVIPVDGIETAALRDARGRVLASDVIAPIDLPPFDNSAVDGYA